jgi:hypothetical protein
MKMLGIEGEQNEYQQSKKNCQNLYSVPKHNSNFKPWNRNCYRLSAATERNICFLSVFYVKFHCINLIDGIIFVFPKYVTSTTFNVKTTVINYCICLQ